MSKKPIAKAKGRPGKKGAVKRTGKDMKLILLDRPAFPVFARLPEDDNPPMTDAELQSMRRVALAKRIRWKLEMSQEAFAKAYRIPIGTLRDWEQHRSEPDQAAVTLLQLIEADPKGILKRLEKVPA